MNSKELWPFLFLIGVLLFNWPFLAIFGLSLPYYLFGLWGIFIIIIRFSIKKSSKQGKTSV